MGGVDPVSLVLGCLAPRQVKAAWGEEGLSCLGSWQRFLGRAQFLAFGRGCCWKRERGATPGGGPFLPNTLAFCSMFKEGEEA